MSFVKHYDTGDKFEDYKLADEMAETTGGRVVAFPDCIAVVVDD